MERLDQHVPVAAVQRGTRGRALLVTWLAVLATVVTWVGVAGTRSGGGPAASGVAAALATPTGEPVSPVPPVGSFPMVGDASRGRVYLRDGGGAGIRSVSLSTGELGPRLGPSSWPDALVALGEGRFACVCIERRPIDGGERIAIRLIASEDRVGQRTGASLVEVDALRERPMPADAGDVFTMAATASPDGRLVAIGFAVRRAPVWQRTIAIVDPDGPRVITTLALPDAATASDGHPMLAWAPTPRFSPDGRWLLVSATLAASPDLTAEVGNWVVPVHPGRHLGRLEPLAGLDVPGATAGCGDMAPAFAGEATVVALCTDGNATLGAVRFVDLGTGDARTAEIGSFFGGAWPMDLPDPVRGTLFLWDPFNGRAMRIDAASGRIEAQAVVDAPPGAASSGSSGSPIGDLAAALSRWLVPTAAAKIMLEPALALAPDGSRLYVVAMANPGRSFEWGKASVVHTLDARTLEPLASWTLAPDIVSIATLDDTVLVGRKPVAADGALADDVSIDVLDATTGSVRQTIEGIALPWPIFVDPANLAP